MIDIKTHIKVQPKEVQLITVEKTIKDESYTTSDGKIFSKYSEAQDHQRKLLWIAESNAQYLHDKDILYLMGYEAESLVNVYFVNTKLSCKNLADKFIDIYGSHIQLNYNGNYGASGKFLIIYRIIDGGMNTSDSYLLELVSLDEIKDKLISVTKSIKRLEDQE